MSQANRGGGWGCLLLHIPCSGVIQSQDGLSLFVKELQDLKGFLTDPDLALFLLDKYVIRNADYFSILNQMTLTVQPNLFASSWKLFFYLNKCEDVKVSRTFRGQAC